MESTPRYSPSFDVESRERLEARMGAPVPLPEHYGHGLVDVDGGHPKMAPSSKENSPPPSPADPFASRPRADEYRRTATCNGP
jgi:hypothetical protein